VHRLVGEIDAAISGFLRGQAAVCLIVGIYYAGALSLIGLKFDSFSLIGERHIRDQTPGSVFSRVGRPPAVVLRKSGPQIDS